MSLVLGPAGVCFSCLSTGRCRKSVRGTFGLGLVLARPLPPFAAGFFFGVVVRDFVAAERVVRLLGAPVVPSLAPAAGARFAAGFLARSLVVAFPPVRGSLGMGSSLERTPAASPQATATARGPRAPAVSGSSRRTLRRASTTAGLNCVPEFASSSSMASSSDMAAR